MVCCGVAWEGKNRQQKPATRRSQHASFDNPELAEFYVPILVRTMRELCTLYVA
jgi:hypothetical protein